MICKKKVLILAANPEDSTTLRLAKEVREIEQIFKASLKRDTFDLKDLGAVQYQDLDSAMLEQKPRIVHFCGHASSQGIMLQDNNEQGHFVGLETLSELFKIHADQVECALINACSSEELAKAISQHINYVIGMKRAVEDEAAIAFTCGFYRAIGAGTSINKAFENGRIAMFESSGGKRRDISISPEDEANNSSAKETIENLPPVLFIRETLNPFPEDEVNTLTFGVEAVKEAMSNPKVRDAVVKFKTEFQIACEQIQILGFYKGLHDMLHQLEFSWFNVVLSNRNQFPEDKTARKTIKEYGYTFRDLFSQYDGAIKQDNLLNVKLSQAKEDLRIAIEQSDAALLTKVISCIKSVLGTYPDKYNTKLNDAAKNLRLSGFLNAMEFIRDKLEDTNLNVESADKIRTGTIALSELEQKLADLVEDHNKWQDLDKELRWLKDTLSDLKYNWSFIKNMAEACCSGSSAEWALELTAEINNLNTAIADDISENIATCFYDFQRVVVSRFYVVDKTLKDFSEELTRIGYSLSTLIESIESFEVL